MKQLVTFILISTVFVASSSFGSEEILEGMKNKAVRGAVDLITGIVEVPVQIYKGYNKGFGLIENKPGSKTIGTILGIFRGFGHAGGRIASGGTELFGFWAANADDNDGVGVPFDADYSWEEGTQYSYFDPSLEEGIKPVGRKLARGLTDSFLGIAELPGQIIKGVNDGDVVLGIGKGIWYTLSRGVSGFGNIVPCIVPNHEDTLGYSYGNGWPWETLTEELE